MAQEKVEYRTNVYGILNRVAKNRGWEIGQLRAARKKMSISFFARFGVKTIDKIFERTLSGLDYNGKPFPKYSEEYKKSLEFKIYGKSDKVNLLLSGEMLNSMTWLSRRNGDLKVYILGKHNNDKARGHHSGKYGKSKNIKVRRFLGLSNSEENEILESSLREFREPFAFPTEDRVIVRTFEGRNEIIKIEQPTQSGF